MKNTVYAVVIVVCLVLALVIFLMTRSGGSGGAGQLKPGEMMWVKCNNPDCKAEYQIDKKDYWTGIEEKVKVNPLSSQTPALVCQKCGKESLFWAVKCENCGKMFFYGVVPSDFADRCPNCKYSKTEAERKARAAGGATQQ
jgi:hypothetical protein